MIPYFFRSLTVTAIATWACVGGCQIIGTLFAMPYAAIWAAGWALLVVILWFVTAKPSA